MIAEYALPQRFLTTLSMRFNIWCGAIILAGWMVAGNAHAIKPFKPSSTELRTLPPYCAARLGSDKNVYQMWEQRLGRESFLHIHHYCYGLNFMNRARFESDPKDKKYYLDNAINNFDYVITRWSPQFQLTSSAKSYKRQAQMMRGR